MSHFCGRSEDRLGVAVGVTGFPTAIVTSSLSPRQTWFALKAECADVSNHAVESGV